MGGSQGAGIVIQRSVSLPMAVSRPELNSTYRALGWARSYTCRRLAVLTCV